MLITLLMILITAMGIYQPLDDFNNFQGDLKCNVVKKLLLAVDKFMPEMYLKQQAFSACGSSTENKEQIQKFKETGDL